MTNLTKWLYRGGKPNWVATILNRLWAAVHALGIAPNYLVTLDVRGRRSGRRISLPLVMVVIEGERYLVSMLGDEVDWVRNVRAEGGHVTLRHGRREEVRLEEVVPDRRLPALQARIEQVICSPIRLMTGIIAFLSAWRSTIARSGRPLDHAVRM